MRLSLTWPAEVNAMGPQQKEAWINDVLGQDRYMPVLRRHGVHGAYHDDIGSINMFDVVMLLDDSGSMNTREERSNITRWGELEQSVRVALDILSALHENGVQVRFLNRPGVASARSWEDVAPCFQRGPSGTTPLTEGTVAALACQQVKPLLLLIACDGEPNDLSSWSNCLAQRDSARCYVSILSCSDREDDVAFLEGIHQHPLAGRNLDVIEEFKLEKQRVHRVHRFAAYHYADHAARWILSAVYPKYDSLDFY